LTRRIRRGDFAFRYGGEEFLVVMLETKTAEAALRAEDFRSLFEQTGINYEGKTIRTTASFGVAVYPDHGDDQEAILKRVDAALYQAKEAGRNRVVVFEDED
jgi:diguanylate cyclase (GGDEF)-like protein